MKKNKKGKRASRKKKRLTKHHNKNRCRGGGNQAENIYWLVKEKHEAWHEIFGNKTFAEAARVLIRVERLKRAYYSKEWL